MASKPKRQDDGRDFQRLLNFHIAQGTAALGHIPEGETAWSTTTLAQACLVQPATIYNWSAGRVYPTPANFTRLRKVMFGSEFDSAKDAIELMSIYQKYSPYWIYVPSVPEDIAGATQQVPAAFRFSVTDDKIAVLPEAPEPIDDDVAIDVYDEVKTKTKDFINGLQGSNIDPRVKSSSQRLLDGLGSSFADVRPGVVLSRMRSMEAIRDAFSTDEGREALFPGAVAAIDDICLSGRDLLSVFPIVREIERQRLALGIERLPNAIENLEKRAGEIYVAASESELVAESAALALSDNDAGIATTGSIDKKADLLADKLLVIRNFAGESIRWVIEGGIRFVDGAWTVVKPEFHEGSKIAAKITPPLIVIALITSIAGPIAGLSTLLHGDVFRPVSGAIKRILSKEPN